MQSTSYISPSAEFSSPCNHYSFICHLKKIGWYFYAKRRFSEVFHSYMLWSIWGKPQKTWEHEIAAVHSENIVLQGQKYELGSNSRLLLVVCNPCLFYNDPPFLQRARILKFGYCSFIYLLVRTPFFFLLVHSYLKSLFFVIRVFISGYADLGSLSPFYYNTFGVVKLLVNQLCGLLITGKPLMCPFSSLSSNVANKRCLLTGCLWTHFLLQDS